MKAKSRVKTRTKIVVATLTTIFTLFTTVSATFAWFATNTQVSISGSSFFVVTNQAEIVSLNLIKFDFNYFESGGLRIYDYLNPEDGDVWTYTYNKTYDDNRGAYVRNSLSGFIEADLMTKYDPVDRIIHGGNLIEMNCNSIYEITFASSTLDDCYLQLKAIFDEKTPGMDQICLSDCVDFEVFYPEDLNDSNILFYDIENDNYHAYYPDYEFKDEADDYLYYKISYLSYLRNSNLTAEQLVEMGILDSEDIEGKTEQQKQKLVVDTLGPSHKNFYEDTPKTQVSVEKNRSIEFSGTPTKTTTVYVNVNYAPDQLEQYFEDIYRKNITAISDFYFDFDFTTEEIE